MNEHQVECRPLPETISQLIRRYLESARQAKIIALHRMVLELVEPALIEAVMSHCRYYQSRAAHLLGISRGAFRMLLKKYVNNTYGDTRQKRSCDEQST